MKTSLSIMLILVSVSILFIACSKDEPDPPTTVFQSKNGDTISHRNGEDCLICHMNGTANRVLVVAGSVYQPDYTTPSPNGTVYFWTQTGGTGVLAATLPVDGKGNFYTNSSILPGQGVFPQIRGASGDIRNMPIKTPNGNCNSCHGPSENPIWVN
jgi:hypothetical protein